MQTIADNFNKSQSEIVVKNVIQAWGTPYYTKLMTAVAAGKGPDIGASHMSELPALASIAILTFIGSWNNFLWPFLCVTSEKFYTIPLGIPIFKIFFINLSKLSTGFLSRKYSLKAGVLKIKYAKVRAIYVLEMSVATPVPLSPQLGKNQTSLRKQ